MTQIKKQNQEIITTSHTKAHFILSKKKALDKYNQTKELADIISYSSKTNPDITPIFEKYTNTHFSIHTPNELKRVKDKSRVYFLAQAIDFKFIDDIIKQGVNKIIIDNIYDLNIIIDYLNKHDKKIELILRTKLKEKSIKTERYFVFGMNVKEINKKIKELKNHPKISKLGIHFHRKTQNMAEWNLIYEIENMFDKETLKSIDYLNIGGGLPSIYANVNVKVFNSIYKKIKELKVWLNKQNIKLIIEPGRYLCAESVELITHIKAIYENNIIVDASVYNSDTDAFTVPTKLLIKGELTKNDKNAQPYVIKGSTPCSMDLFRYRVYLNNPKTGDKLIFINAGAYNFYCDFCDLEKLKTIIIEQ